MSLLTEPSHSASEPDLSAGEWNRLLAPYKRPHRGRALSQLATSAIPFVLCWAAMAWAFRAGLPWLLPILAFVASAFFLRIFIIQHDCGHGSFFRSKRANDWLGAVIGVATFFPYGYWRRTHAIHHATHGNLDRREFGDVRTRTVREYRESGFWGRFGYRLYRNPIVLFGVGPIYQFVIKHRFPFDIPWTWKKEWASVLWTDLAILAVGGGLSWWLGWQTVVAVQLTIVMVAGALGVWLFYVQHQFEDAYWDDDEAWDYYHAAAHGSSFYDLPRWLHWCTGNIGYHHIHHLSSRIPNYRLRECFEENPELQRVTRLTLLGSLSCIRLRLWDEERREMVGFGDVDLEGDRRRVAA
jgi:omega-6 fatty acid desaturase (delta-12 desaturase)